jgi:hypothetical protein
VIFRPELAAKVMAGEKSVTRRAFSDNPRSPWYRFRCAYIKGKRFTINPGRGKVRIGEARVISCRAVQLGALNKAEAHMEGFASVSAFVTAWSEINGTWDVEAFVWRIEFEVVS